MSETAGSKALARVARIWSLSSIVFVLLFIFGEGLSGQGASPAKAEWIGLTLWPVGVTVGLIVGWFRAGLGGIIAITALLAFYAWNLLEHGKFPGRTVFRARRGSRVPFPFIVALVAAASTDASRLIRRRSFLTEPAVPAAGGFSLAACGRFFLERFASQEVVEIRQSFHRDHEN